MATLALLLLLFLLLCSALQLALADLSCPEECRCDDKDGIGLELTCEGALWTELPSFWPNLFSSLLIRNSSITGFGRLSFRRLDRLRSIRVEYCQHFEYIDKFAFKGLRKLRLLSFVGNPSLRELQKAAFSGVANEFGLRIRVTESALETVHGGAFRHAQNIRELTLEGGAGLRLARHALASIRQLDFLSLRGVRHIDGELFVNSTRFHVVRLSASQLETMPRRAFATLAHVHQILVHDNSIETISEGAFAGIETVENLEIFDNRIGKIEGHAFTGMANVGKLRLERNTVKALPSPEAILTEASLVRVLDNNLECSCDLRWTGHHQDHRLADANYCGSRGVHRTVRRYVNAVCDGGGEEALVGERLASLGSPAASSLLPLLLGLLLLLFM